MVWLINTDDHASVAFAQAFGGMKIRTWSNAWIVKPRFIVAAIPRPWPISRDERERLTTTAPKNQVNITALLVPSDVASRSIHQTFHEVTCTKTLGELFKTAY